MKQLNRYLLSEFFTLFIGALILFVVLVTIAELSAQLSYYTQNPQYLKYFLTYHLARIPHNVYYIFPIALMFSSTYVLGTFVKNKEMIAVQNSGISLFEFSMPMFVSVIILCLLLVFFWQFVAAPLNKISFGAFDTARGHRPNINSGSWSMFGANNRVFFIENYYYFDKYMTNAIILELKPSGGISNRLSSPYIKWDEDKKKWNAENGLLTTFSEDKEIKVELVTNYMLDVLERPDHFTSRPRLDTMSLTEEYKLIKLQKEVNIKTSKLETDLHYRISYCFSGFIIVLLASLFCKFSTQSVLVVSLVLVIAVALVYYSILMLFRSLGDNGTVNPILAAWMPNIIFAILCRLAFMKFY